MNDVNEQDLLPEAVAADLVDLGDALDACGALVERGKEDYASDEMLRYAAEALCNRMGEAVQRLDAGWRETMPGVPWRAIRDNRNVVVHAYRGIDSSTLRTRPVDGSAGLKTHRDSRRAGRHRVTEGGPPTIPTTLDG